MLKKLILLGAILFQTSVQAQVCDSLLLLTRKKGRANGIAYARFVLFSGITSGDTSRVKEIYACITKNLENERYHAFYPDEYVLVNFWLRQYKVIKDYSLKIDQAFLAALYKKKLPADDWLEDALREFLRPRRAQVLEQLNRAGELSREDRDFVKLVFDQIMSWGEGAYPIADSLNEYGHEFMARYPGTVYKKYVETYVGLEYKAKTWNYSAEFYSGLGFCTGNLGGKIGPILPIGVDFDLKYRHAFLRFTDCIGFTKTQDTIIDNWSVWDPGSQARVFLVCLSAGYYVVNTPKLKLSPFIGLSTTAITAPLFHFGKEVSEDVGFDFTATTSFGVSADIYIGKEEKELNRTGNEHSLLRFSYTVYLPQFEKKYPGSGGLMHNLTVGYVMMGNPYRRLK